MSSSIKIERFLPLEITRQGGTISIAPANSIYLLVPADIVEKLKTDFNLDLRKHRKQMTIKTSLAKERVVTSNKDDPYEIHLIFTLYLVTTSNKPPLVKL